MDLRKVLDNMGRVKVYYLKGETLKALQHAVMGLQALGSAASPTDVRSAIRDAVQMLSRDEMLRAKLKNPLVYQPGKEPQLLGVLSKAYKEMEEEASREELEVTRERKKKLDQAMLQGVKYLEQGKPSEADVSFQEAVAQYKDETKLFQMIGKYMLDADQPRRAAPYLKKAAELEPDNPQIRELVLAAIKARDTANR